MVRESSELAVTPEKANCDQGFISTSRRKNKDRSIFRKNVGRAPLNRSNDPFLAHWELDLTTGEAKREYATGIDFAKQRAVEAQVTKYIQEQFTFVALRVDDKATRLDLGAKMISTVSLCDEWGPSNQWLGFHSPKRSSQ
jgi:hypothetical protein